MRILFFVILSTISCNQISTIEIRNLSDKRIDSLKVVVNEHQFSIDSIAPNTTALYTFDKELTKAYRDVTYYVTGYISDSIVLKEVFFSNDLGYVPDSVRIVINDSLKLKYIELWPEMK